MHMGTRLTADERTRLNALETQDDLGGLDPQERQERDYLRERRLAEEAEDRRAMLDAQALGEDVPAMLELAREVLALHKPWVVIAQSRMAGALRAATASIVAEFGFLVNGVLHVEALRTALKRAADVEVLDQHAATDDERFWTSGPCYLGGSSFCSLRCSASMKDTGRYQHDPFFGPTPDKARANAVEWIKAERKAGR
jgi:hypothetical protein